MTSTLQQLIDLVGAEKTEALCRAYGGVDYYIPHHPRADHPWAGLLGQDAWQRLCAFYSGGVLTLPKGDRTFARLRVEHLLAQDKYSGRQIARMSGCTERSVRRWRSRMHRRPGAKPAPAVPLPLFDERDAR